MYVTSRKDKFKPDNLRETDEITGKNRLMSLFLCACVWFSEKVCRAAVKNGEIREKVTRKLKVMRNIEKKILHVKLEKENTYCLNEGSGK